MGISFPSLPRGYRYPVNVALSSFAGGVNNRDAASELGPADVIDSWNVTYDERGGAASRLGAQKYNGSVYGSDLIQNEFWSSIASTKLVNAGLKLYKGTSTTAVKTFTTTERVTFTEMGTLIVACHPTDGLFTSPDGATWTAVADPDAPKGTCVATWQNKLWVGKPNGGVQWSSAGDATAWVATDFNNLWEKDSRPIVALHIGSGQDIKGSPGLLAYKLESAYRINDSSTGAYDTVDATVGCASAIAVVGVGAKVFSLSRRGVYMWQEGQSGLLNVSDKLKPLWDPSQVNLAQLDKWCAGRATNRALFSLTRNGATANNLALELHADQGWLAPGSNAVSAYSMSTGTSDAVYGGSPTVAGQSYQLYTGGTDDGAAIAGRLQTRWMDLLGGYKASIIHLRVRGRGTGTVQLRKDYHESGDNLPLDMSEPTSITYDSGLKYDNGNLYYVPADEPTQTLYGIGTCRQMSLLFTFSNSTTAAAPQVLGSGTAPAVGPFAVFMVEAVFMRLGLS